MVDPKAMTRQLRDTIKSVLTDGHTCDYVTIRHLLASHEVADAEISRLTAENASLRLDMEGARKAIEDVPHGRSCQSLDPLCEVCAKPRSKCISSRFRDKPGIPRTCDCFKSRTLALLHAPGEPGKLMEALFEVARLQQAVDAEQGDAPVELEYELQDKVAALCALVPPEKK